MTGKVYYRIIGAILLIATLALAACAAPATPTPEGEETAPPAETEAPSSPEPEEEEEDTEGGTVVLILPEEPTTLNMYMSAAAVVRQVADATSATGLVTVDENGEFQPVLATELPTLENGGLSEDLLTVTWNLRPGLLWSDGEPLTSDDVKFTWEAVSHPDSGAVIAEGFNQIESVETPDELTAVVTYSEPFAGYLNQFTYGVLPRHATGAPEDMMNWDWNREPVGAGPFVLSEWKAGESITLERNPYYFEEGKPRLDELVFVIVPEPAAQTAMMMRGEAQVHLWPGEEEEEEYNELLGDMGAQITVPGTWNMAIEFNMSQPFDDDPGPTPPHPILGDIRVRQAIASAIDYETLLAQVMPNTAPSTNPFAYGWYECDIARQYPYDPDTANQLLEEAGWVMGNDGIRVADGAEYAEDGTRLTMELQGYTNFEPLQRTEEFIVENLREVGVEARIQNYDFSIIFGSYSDGSPRKTGDFDMLIYDRAFGLEPQAEIFARYHSSDIPTADNPDGRGYMRWVNEEADELIETAGRNFDLQVRKDAYCQLGELIVNEDVVQIFLYLFQDGFGFSSRLDGYTVSTWGSMTWDVQNWFYTSP